MGDRSGGEFVQTVARALSVIRAFDASSPEQTLSEVARTTGLSRGATRRFLLTLTELGYVRSDGRKFMLTARVLELGYAYLSSLSLPDVALPHLRDLVELLMESASLAVLDNDVVVSVASVPSSRILNPAITVGTRYPAYATAAGRVLLAGLTASRLDAYLAATPLQRFTERTVTSEADLRAAIEDVRTRGWSLVDQELEDGLAGAAAPIHDAADQVVAAITIGCRTSASALAAAPDLVVPPLLAAVRRIEAELGRVCSTSAAPG